MFYYLSKESLLDGDIVVVLQSISTIQNYKEITNQGELVEYEGDSIPAQWEYDEQEDYLYDVKDKPSPYHMLVNKKWVVQDKTGYRNYCNENIDKIKTETLTYGFDYQGHRQRCRDKDIAFMVSTVVGLQVAKNVMNLDKTITWYFEDGHGVKMDLIALSTLMMYGATFIQSVYDTESYFKKLEIPKLITKDEFETKRKEIHLELVKK